MSVFDPFIAFLKIVARPVFADALVHILLVVAAGDHDALVIVKQVIGVRDDAGHIYIIALFDIRTDHIGPGDDIASVFALYEACADGDHIDSVLCPLCADPSVRGGSPDLLLPGSASLFDGGNSFFLRGSFL